MSREVTPIAAEFGQIVQSYQASVDDFDREVARVLGINETAVRCLEILIQADGGPVTPRLLADRLGLTTGSVTAMLDRLEKLGYIIRTPHPTDRRKLIVRPTDIATQRAFELIMPLVGEGQQQLLIHYTDQQLELVGEVLARLTDLQHSHTNQLRERRPYPRA